MESMELDPEPSIRQASITGSAEYDKLVGRFADSDQLTLRRWMEAHPRFAQLSRIAPAAALCICKGDAWRGKRAFQMVVAGAPLTHIERVLGLQTWTRQLPPEALHAALPHLWAGQAPSPLERLMPDLIPAQFSRGSRWLTAFGEALDFGDEAFALWLARQMKHMGYVPDKKTIILLAAYRFSCSRRSSGSERARTASSARKAFRGALQQAQDWRMNQALDTLRAQREAIVPGCSVTFAQGFQCTILDNVAAIRMAGRRMRNCLPHYVASAAIGRSLLVLIEDGAELGCMEAGSTGVGRKVLAMRQLCGPFNSPPTEKMRLAGLQWVDRMQRLAAIGRPREARLRPATSPEADCLEAFWQSCEAREIKRTALWTPSASDAEAFKSYGQFPLSASSV